MVTDLRVAEEAVDYLLIEQVIASPVRLSSVTLVRDLFHQIYLRSVGMFGFDVLIIKYFKVDIPPCFLAAIVQGILRSLPSHPRLSL
jgi:hypothetical protein